MYIVHAAATIRHREEGRKLILLQFLLSTLDAESQIHVQHEVLEPRVFHIFSSIISLATAQRKTSLTLQVGLVHNIVILSL